MSDGDVNIFGNCLVEHGFIESFSIDEYVTKVHFIIKGGVVGKGKSEKIYALDELPLKEIMFKTYVYLFNNTNLPLRPVIRHALKEIYGTSVRQYSFDVARSFSFLEESVNKNLCHEGRLKLGISFDTVNCFIEIYGGRYHLLDFNLSDIEINVNTCCLAYNENVSFIDMDDKVLELKRLIY